MFFSSKHGLFGMFQLPVNVLAVILLIANVSIVAYDLSDRFTEFAIRSVTIPDYFWTTMLDFPTIKEFFLARDIQITLPLILSFVLGIYLIVFAHRFFKEELRRHITSAIAYMIVMPYFTTANWIVSVAKEVSRSKRKW